QDSRPHDARTARQSAGDMTVLSTNGAVARLALIFIIGFAFTTARSQPPDAFSVKVVSQLDLPAFGAGVAAAWSEDGSRVAVASQFDGMDAPLHSGIKRAQGVVSASHFTQRDSRW